jgi:CBS domain-containing protein
MFSEVQDAQPVRQGSSAGDVKLRQIMSDEVICARGTLRMSAVIRLMMQHHIGCLPVVDSRRHPIGVITKFDLVEQFENSSEVHARTAEDLMLPLALTLSEASTVAHAAAMMVLEDTHHVLVVSATGALTGVVSTYDIVKWLVENERGSCGYSPCA